MCIGNVIIIIIHCTVARDGRARARPKPPRRRKYYDRNRKGFAFPPLIRDNIITCVFLINAARAGRRPSRLCYITRRLLCRRHAVYTVHGAEGLAQYCDRVTSYGVPHLIFYDTTGYGYRFFVPGNLFAHCFTMTTNRKTPDADSPYFLGTGGHRPQVVVSHSPLPTATRYVYSPSRVFFRRRIFYPLRSVA